ncbi:hypothetical protein [Saccharopolyspora elongata]|uniref:Uncharacterized protein n=1 Tax=Saccharopolyspora elongata TaxID=2530387 RepID=A0A4R4Y9A2_9PSEU|nr:hypothetical protein [Saccharopolyspora elongata]TDD40299.1 hypothetical protein E1288_35815 [Saccharopolyspora elongata]
MDSSLVLAKLPGWLRPHLAAIEDTCRAGFVFAYWPSRENPLSLHAFHKAHGAMDTYSATSTEDAVAARFRLEDLETARPQPLWYAAGTVTDVVAELMRLPPHGSKGAPRLALSVPSELWVPSIAQSSSSVIRQSWRMF